MKKIVFLTDQYWPNPSAVGNCVAGIIQSLKNKSDIEITVFSVATTLDGNAAKTNINERIIRYESQEKKRIERLGSHSTSGKIFSTLAKGKRFLSAFSPGAHFDHKLYQFYLEQLEILADEPDLLVATCFPPAAIFAGASYATMHHQTKYIPYLFDPFADNEIYHRGAWNVKRLEKKHRALERDVLESAYRVLIVRHLSKYYKTNYPIYQDKFIITEQPTLFLRQVDPSPALGHRPLTFVYTGSLNKQMRPPEKILNVMLAVNENYPLTVHFYAMGNAISELDAFSEMKPNVIFNHGQVSKVSADEALAQADVLLSIGNLAENLSPSKIFEYIGYGKPILHFAYRLNDDVIEILRDYPLAFSIDLSIDDAPERNGVLINAMIEWLKSCRNKRVTHQEILSAYSRALPENIADILLNFLQGENK